jgi:hypothetical protein
VILEDTMTLLFIFMPTSFVPIPTRICVDAMTFLHILPPVSFVPITIAKRIPVSVREVYSYKCMRRGSRVVNQTLQIITEDLFISHSLQLTSRVHDDFRPHHMFLCTQPSMTCFDLVMFFCAS